MLQSLSAKAITLATASEVTSLTMSGQSSGGKNSSRAPEIGSEFSSELSAMGAESLEKARHTFNDYRLQSVRLGAQQ